jgi:hypothetical protein
VGLRADLDRYGKFSPASGFDPRTVQPVPSRYTDDDFWKMCAPLICKENSGFAPPPDTVPWEWNFVTATATNQPKESVKQKVSDLFQSCPFSAFFRSIYSICYTDGTCTKHQHCAQLTRYPLNHTRITLHTPDIQVAIKRPLSSTHI